jgi:hypothetical protein
LKSRRREIKKAINHRWQPFVRGYRVRFRDLRHFHRFEKTMRGLMIAGTPKLQRMGATNWTSGSSDANVKGISRFLRSSQFDWQTLLEPLYGRARSLCLSETKVLGLIDLTPIEKPYARKMEALCRVMKNDGSGTTRGYEMVSILLRRGEETGLGYVRLFSHEAEAMSQNHEIDQAMSLVRRRLPNETKIIWVWDRGFDDRKNYQRVAGWRDEFVGRAYHNRRVEVGGRSRCLLSWGQRLAVRYEFCAQLSFGGRRRRLRIGLSWSEFEFEGKRLWLLRAQLLWVEGMDLAKLDDRDWWLVTNIPIKNKGVARTIWGYYRKRWEIESFFKFAKEGLSLEGFQVLKLEAIRRLTALVIIAALFIYKLIGGEAEQPIQQLFRLGGWSGRGKPGKFVLLRGVSAFLGYESVGCFLKGTGFT